MAKKKTTKSATEGARRVARGVFVTWRNALNCDRSKLQTLPVAAAAAAAREAGYEFFVYNHDLYFFPAAGAPVKLDVPGAKLDAGVMVHVYGAPAAGKKYRSWLYTKNSYPASRAAAAAAATGSVCSFDLSQLSAFRHVTNTPRATRRAPSVADFVVFFFAMLPRLWARNEKPSLGTPVYAQRRFFVSRANHYSSRYFRDAWTSSAPWYFPA
jgi:hypothetical protein